MVPLAVYNPLLEMSFFSFCMLFCLRLEVFRNHFMAPFFIHCCVGQHSLLDGLLCHVVPPLYLRAFSIKRLPRNQVSCQCTIFHLLGIHYKWVDHKHTQDFCQQWFKF